MFIKVVALESGGGLLAVPPVGYTLALGRGLSLPVAAVPTVPGPESDEEKDCWKGSGCVSPGGGGGVISMTHLFGKDAALAQPSHRLAGHLPMGATQHLESRADFLSTPCMFVRSVSFSQTPPEATL